ncbi:MAG: phosphodiesterase [Gammaproteobacteria bacterium]|nr:phosphodiesterase [Gammaproteobacteria bacterium]
MSVRIVQLTDLHLYKRRDGVLAGVPTWETFSAVQQLVRDRHADFDYLVLTGDLAQDEARETYEMLREALGDWLACCRIVPGNHDDPAHLRAVFPELFGNDSQSLNFSLACGEWRIAGLDSQVVGEVNGRVGVTQLEWLRERLTEPPAAPTLIFVHHPPLPIGVDWLDTLGLDEAEQLVSLIAESPQVKLVCAGHVHQEWQGHIGESLVCTTPSTCVQFGARSEKSFDSKAAGYRTITLEADGRYTTAVHRLSDA